MPFIARKLGIVKDGKKSLLIANASRHTVYVYTYSDDDRQTKLMAEIIVQEKISSISIDADANLIIAFANGTFSRAVPL